MSAAAVAKPTTTSSVAAAVSLSDMDLPRLLEAMEHGLESLDRETKREYEEAQEVMPSLVATETPYIPFLRAEDFQPRPAAKRLALYWKWRKTFFKERWLLPMTQTGRGCLNPADIALLRTGVIHFQSGEAKQVCIIDYAKPAKLFPNGAPRDLCDMINRTSMYAVTVNFCFEQRECCEVTAVFLVTPEERLATPPNRQHWVCIHNALPVKVDKIFVPRAYEPHKLELLDFASFQTTKVVGFNTGLVATLVQGNSVSETVQNMELAGFMRKYIPMQIGGEWDHSDDVAKWTRMRLNVEDVMGSAPPTTITTTSLLNNQHAPHEMMALTKPRPARGRQKSEDREAFCRDRRAMYSRRFYHRRKLNILSLQDEVRELSGFKDRLKQENNRLQGLLQQARFIEWMIVNNGDVGTPGVVAPSFINVNNSNNNVGTPGVVGPSFYVNNGNVGSPGMVAPCLIVNNSNNDMGTPGIVGPSFNVNYGNVGSPGTVGTSF